MGALGDNTAVAVLCNPKQDFDGAFLFTSLLFNPTPTLTSCSYGDTARLWDVETGACIHILRRHNNSGRHQAAYRGASQRLSMLLWAGLSNVKHVKASAASENKEVRVCDGCHGHLGLHSSWQEKLDRNEWRVHITRLDDQTRRYLSGSEDRGIVMIGLINGKAPIDLYLLWCGLRPFVSHLLAHMYLEDSTIHGDPFYKSRKPQAAHATRGIDRQQTNTWHSLRLCVA